jgi:universal stress protein E
MGKLETICVGIDFSPTSETALRTAANLARFYGSRLWIVTVVEPPALYQRVINPIQSSLVPTDELAARARGRLADLAATGAADGVKVTTEVRVGTPFVELIGASRGSSADLLVVGACRHGEVERLLLPSTAERVQRKAPMPVLLVKADLPPRPRIVLAPTDFSRASLPALKMATDLARSWDARLILLHVIEPIAQAYVWPADPAAVDLFLAEPEDLQPEWRSFLAPLDLTGVRSEQQTVKGYAKTTIVATARQSSADLIVMGTHGRTGLMHILLGSVAERTSREAPCSVLSVRPEDFEFRSP